jgi:gamma-glutamyltranspeptidase/glutathione hydrolase
MQGLNAGVPFAEGNRGVVAAKHILAAQAGVQMLERGGNAVDAAVATAFAIGVVEPWMNGLGGVGYMVIQPASGEAPLVVDYSAVAPRAAHAEMFSIVDGRSSGLFPWPLVADDANQQGWRSVCVPGTARGLGLALERFGRLDLPTVMAPAIRLAADGFPVSWWTTLRIAIDAPTLVRYPETARTFMPNGFALTSPASNELPATLLVQAELAETLQRLARYGVDEFYTGETAHRIVSSMRDNGGVLAADDLADYQARVSPALTVEYAGWRIGTPGGLTGGTTLARILSEFSPGDAPFGSTDYVDHLLRSFQRAFTARYADLGDEERAPVAEPVGTSTTHLAAADADGTVVSLTQTLLATFGSRVTVPGTGVLLNDGMYWFDPRPGLPNSVGPGKRPLSNMTPLVAMGVGGWPRLGLGSSGGRRIVSANVQLVLAMLDGGMPIGEALSAPRLDASGERVLADMRVPAALVADLQARGWDVLAVEESPFPRHFASPAGVAAYADGRRAGASDPLMPSGVAAF